jgi:hypothetical protein
MLINFIGSIRIHPITWQTVCLKWHETGSSADRKGQQPKHYAHIQQDNAPAHTVHNSMWALWIVFNDDQ